MIVSRKLVARARELRQRQSRTEAEVWEIVRNRRLGGAKFRRQLPIERYVADFPHP
jgi:very-short-patch-repair endonuclease